LACPYFVPREIVYDLSWPHPARLPLGAGWTGTCCAASHKATDGAVAPNIADSKIADSKIADSKIVDLKIAEARISDLYASTLASTLAVDSALIRDCCNLGYAAACPHLPVSRDWDAIRFSIAGLAPNQITLCYVCEFAHAPKAHGTLTYDLIAEAWCEAPEAAANELPANAAAPVTTAVTASAAGDARVRRLAASYLHAYRIRQSAGQSFDHSDEQSDVQTGAPA
jgi:hypothetical protein